MLYYKRTLTTLGNALVAPKGLITSGMSKYASVRNDSFLHYKTKKQMETVFLHLLEPIILKKYKIDTFNLYSVQKRFLLQHFETKICDLNHFIKIPGEAKTEVVFSHQ